MAEGAATVVVSLLKRQGKDKDGEAQLKTWRDRRKHVGSSFSLGMALQRWNPVEGFPGLQPGQDARV
jgi:hypothetical protein